MSEQFSTEHIAKAVEKLIEEPKQSIADDLKAYFIQMLQNADFVQVVRCKDCEYGIENGELCGRKVYLCSAMTNPNEFYGDFYCEGGERRESE